MVQTKAVRFTRGDEANSPAKSVGDKVCIEDRQRVGTRIHLCTPLVVEIVVGSLRAVVSKQRRAIAVVTLCMDNMALGKLSSAWQAQNRTIRLLGN
jgi:hypothetical protein